MAIPNRDVNTDVSRFLEQSPVALILVDNERNETHAAAISFFSEVAHYPVSLWVSLAKSSHAHGLVTNSTKFSLAVLHEKQLQVAREYGPINETGIFCPLRLPGHRDPQGFAFLADALASVACRVRDTLDIGDHTLFVGDIVGGELETKHSGRRHLLVSDLS